MTIKDMEARSGLPRANIRYYESEGLLSPTRAPNGYRDYSEDDLATLRKVKLLRELGCSLEEIAALQREEAALADVVERRLAALEREAASLERAKAVCARLRADGATYATLEPERYVPKGEPPLIPWEPIPDAPLPRYPWRRLFARGLDYLLVVTLLLILPALFFDVSIFRHGFWRKAAFWLLSLAVTLAVEPLFLHRWGTTPGKWVFRLRLIREDGAPLDLADAFGRTLNVLLAGCGLWLPLVPLLTCALAFSREGLGAPQPWAVEGEVFESAQPGKEFRAAKSVGLCALAVAGCLGLLVCGELKVARLPYPHPTTYREFAANYNKISTYQVDFTRRWAELSVLPDNVDGLWYHENEGVYDTAYYHTGYPHMFFQFADPEEPFTSALVTVGMDMDRTTKDPVYYPGLTLSYALQALEGDSAFFLNPYSDLSKRCHSLQFGRSEELARLPEKTWHAYLDYSAVGGGLQKDDTGQWMLFKPQDLAKYDEDLHVWLHYPTTQHVTLTFCLRRK